MSAEYVKLCLLLILLFSSWNYSQASYIGTLCATWDANFYYCNDVDNLLWQRLETDCFIPSLTTRTFGKCITAKGYLHKPVSYYANSTSTYQLHRVIILSNDVQENPGPETHINNTANSANRPAAKNRHHADHDTNEADNMFKPFYNKGIHFFHLNTRSLLPKMSEVKLFASKSRAKVIMITETWLDHTVTDREIGIPEFSVIRKDRNRQGGGVCIYFHSSLAFNPRPDLDLKNLEAIWAEILLPRTKPILAGCCYGEKKTKFIDKLEEVVSKLPIDSEIYVMGDMNLDSVKKESLYIKYEQMLQLHGFKQLIFEPTRFGPDSETGLDHVICNNQSKLSQSGVIITGVSDHIMTYCTRKTAKPIAAKQHVYAKIRSTKNYSKELFVSKLMGADWLHVTHCVDVDKAWSVFCENFTNILDQVAPVKEVRIKNHTEPWMSNEILNDIRERDSWLKKFKNNKHVLEYYSNYCRLRNKVQKHVRKAKQDYMVNKISENKNNPKKLWQNLKTLGYSKKGDESGKIVLNKDGVKIHESKDVANHFNTFFYRNCCQTR